MKIYHNGHAWQLKLENDLQWACMATKPFLLAKIPAYCTGIVYK